MSLSLIVFAFFALFMAYRGYRTGLIGVIFRFVSLASAYLFAFLFTPQVSVWVQNNSQLNGMLAFAAAGLLVFVVSGFLVDLILSMLKKILLPKNSIQGQVSAIGGAGLGLIFGGVLGLVAVWFISIISDITAAKQESEGGKKSPAMIEKMAKAFTGSIVKSAVNVATDEEDVANITSLLLSQPSEFIDKFQRLSKSKELKTVLTNPRYVDVLNRKNPNELAKLPAFKALVRDPDFQSISNQFGLDKEGDEPDKVLAKKVIEMWTRVQHIKDDPEIRNIVQNPDFQNVIQSGDVFKLMNDERFVLLMKRLQSDEMKVPVTFNEASDQVYRWVDEKGRVHFSDKQPESEDGKN